MSIRIEARTPDHADVVALAGRMEQRDAAPPLSDQTYAQLASTTVEHLIARDDGRLVGYAQRDGAALEIAGDPQALEPLLAAALADSPADLLVWTHGRRSSLVSLLESRDFSRERELHQLRRPLDGTLPADPPLPADITVRSFEPGVDDEAWLALNAAAFVHHPEQGTWTDADLQARLAEPWFEAAGFLLAERAGALIAFHWTKVHPDGLGEVYVLGVAPDAQGLGLGGALLVRGLRHLAEVRRCPAVLLYVDGDNPAALRLYERDGFTRYDLDIQWRRGKAFSMNPVTQFTRNTHVAFV